MGKETDLLITALAVVLRVSGREDGLIVKVHKVEGLFDQQPRQSCCMEHKDVAWCVFVSQESHDGLQVKTIKTTTKMRTSEGEDDDVEKVSQEKEKKK